MCVVPRSAIIAAGLFITATIALLGLIVSARSTSLQFVEVLKARLTDRSTESEQSLSRRLFKAQFEMSFQDKFDVVLISEDLSKSLREAQTLYDNFKNTP